MTEVHSGGSQRWDVVAAVVFISFVLVRLIRAVALARKVVDRPNERSLHTVPVPRLGGAVVVPVGAVAIALLWPEFALPGEVRIALAAGCAALYVISLFDDLKSLPVGLRFVVQLGCAGVLLWSMFGPILILSTGSVSEIWLRLVGIAVLGLWLVGLINIYNFMDGIDGIAGLQAVLGGVTWAIVGTALGMPATVWVASCTAAALAGFLAVNWPPAKIFLGDAGSTVLGYFFGSMPLLASVESGGKLTLAQAASIGVLAIWPFLADASFTLFRRWRAGENLLRAHRTHLYQRLVIAGQSHRTVTLTYGGLAMVGAVLAWLVVRGYDWAILLAGVVVTVLFGCLWRWTVTCEKERAARSA